MLTKKLPLVSFTARANFDSNQPQPGTFDGEFSLSNVPLPTMNVGTGTTCNWSASGQWFHQGDGWEMSVQIFVEWITHKPAASPLFNLTAQPYCGNPTGNHQGFARVTVSVNGASQWGAAAGGVVYLCDMAKVTRTREADLKDPTATFCQGSASASFGNGCPPVLPLSFTQIQNRVGPPFSYQMETGITASIAIDWDGGCSTPETAVEPPPPSTGCKGCGKKSYQAL